MSLRGFLNLARARFAPAADSPQVTVRALGPLQISIGPVLLTRFGGDHAGSNQAQALMAALLDRGATGVTKDEIVDLLWPESDLAHADNAFHRTLLGLRGVLAQGRQREVISYRSGRYRLSPDLVIKSDVLEFERLLTLAALASGDRRISRLEAAVCLYRGDYLDDCPYYGESAQVEARRGLLRRAYLQATQDLAAAYADGGVASLGLLRAFEAQGFAPLHGGWVLAPTGYMPPTDAAPERPDTARTPEGAPHAAAR